MRIVKKILKLFLGRQYFRLVLLWQLRNSKKYPPILIYQMGKVGSKAIENVLEKKGLPNAILHVHVLSREGIEQGELFKRSVINGNEEYWKNIYLREILEKNEALLKWKVITLVREPISRNISAYFENSDLWLQQIDFTKVSHSSDMDTLTNDFFDNFDHERPLKWFDMEIKNILNIDVFAETFPNKIGYKIYHKENVDLLVMRLESLKDIFDSALHEFLEMDGLTLAQNNMGSTKAYSQLYTRFKNKIQLPNAYIEKMYSSEYSRHFYSEEELAVYKSQWSRRSELQSNL